MSDNDRVRDASQRVIAAKMARSEHATWGYCIAPFGLLTFVCPGCRALKELEDDARIDYDLAREEMVKNFGKKTTP